MFDYAPTPYKIPGNVYVTNPLILTTNLTDSHLSVLMLSQSSQKHLFTSWKIVYRETTMYSRRHLISLKPKIIMKYHWKSMVSDLYTSLIRLRPQNLYRFIVFAKEPLRS